MQQSNKSDRLRLMTHPERLAAYGEPTTLDLSTKRLVPDAAWKREHIVCCQAPWPVPHSRWGNTRPLWVHRKAVDRFRDLFDRWKAAGLLDRLRTLNGTLNIRMKRGHETSLNLARLSTHSFGAAIDLNAQWNRFGHEPAPAGAEGSLVELVPIARECGFVWGGEWHKPDGMHFEVGVVPAPTIRPPAAACRHCGHTWLECAKLSETQGACCSTCDHS